MLDVKYGKKYEHLLKVAEQYPTEKFYKLHSVSTTRFAGYFYLILKAILSDILFIIESFEERALDSTDEEAKRLLRRIANVKFLGLLAGLVDIYAVIGSLCGNLQKVNLFIWERQLLVKSSLTTLKEMSAALRQEDVNPQFWPTSHKYWPLLKNNTLVRGIPYLEQETVHHYFSRHRRGEEAEVAESTGRKNVLATHCKNFLTI